MPDMKPQARTRRAATRVAQAGLSMVELLIAMALGLFLTAGILQVFVSSKAASRGAEAQARVQENGRFAVQMLASDLRGTRGTGCQNVLLAEAQDRNWVLACDLRGADGATDCSGASVIGSGTPLGYAASQRGGPEWLAQLPGSAEYTVARQWLRGDVLVSWGTVGEGVYAGSPADASPSRPIDLLAPQRDLVGGRLALITDCEATDVFMITNPSRCQGRELEQPESLNHGTSYDADASPEVCGEEASEGHSDQPGIQANSQRELSRAYNSKGTTLRARVFPFEYSVYYVCCMDNRTGTLQEGNGLSKCATDPGRYRPMLCRWSASSGAQQYVSDVADLRVTFDGSLGSWGGPRFPDGADAAWVTAQDHWDRVDSARIQILATTAEEVRTAAAAPNLKVTGTSDLGYGLAADRRIYEPFEATAAIRSNTPWYVQR